jgi:hypothetical protein
LQQTIAENEPSPFETPADVATGILGLALIPAWYAWCLWFRSIPTVAIAILPAAEKGPPALTHWSFLLLCLIPVSVAQFLFWLYIPYRPAGQRTPGILRGRRLTDFFEAQQLQKAVGSDTPSVYWGGLRVRIDRTLTHFAIIGVSRSGKSTCLRLIMQDILPRVASSARFGGAWPKARALVFDPKTEFLPVIVGMGVSLDIVTIINPFDARSVAWDIAAEIETPSDAWNMAAIFIPDDDGKDKFFPAAARDIFAHVLLALHFTGCKWTLRDVLLVFRDLNRLKKLLGRNDLTKSVLQRYSGDARTLSNVMATLGKNLSQFEPIAACWEHATKRIDIRRWLKTETILVLGYDEARKEQLRVINRCLFRRFTDIVLSASASKNPTNERTWVILDECREMDRLEGLSSLLLRGSGFGVCTFLGYQVQEGMESVYGDGGANEIAAQCSNFAVLRLGSARKTAEWASKLLGERLEIDTLHGTTDGPQESSTNTTQQIHERPLFFPSELQDLPATNAENGLQGIFTSDQFGAIDAKAANVSGDELFGHLLKPDDKSVPEYIPRDKSEHFLKDWDQADLCRLGMIGADARSGNSDPLDQVRRIS